MTKGNPMFVDIIRAWKDQKSRNSLGEAERAAVTASTAELIELTAEEIRDVSGGGDLIDYWSVLKDVYNSGIGEEIGDYACHLTTCSAVEQEEQRAPGGHDTGHYE